MYELRQRQTQPRILRDIRNHRNDLLQKLNDDYDDKRKKVANRLDRPSQLYAPAYSQRTRVTRMYGNRTRRQSPRNHRRTPKHRNRTPKRRTGNLGGVRPPTPLGGVRPPTTLATLNRPTGGFAPNRNITRA